MKNPRLIFAFLLPWLWFAVVPVGMASDYSEALELYHSGQYQKCLEAVDSAIEDNAYGEQWHVLRIQAQLTIGEYEDALESMLDSISRYPNSIQLRWIGMQAARWNNATVQALQWHDEIHELEATSGWRYRDSQNQVILGLSHLARGEDAKEVLDRYFRGVLERSSNHIDAHLAIARAALDKQDFQLAAEHFQKAVDLDQRDPDAVFGLARAYAPSDSSRSTRLMERALLLNPRHVPTLLDRVGNQIDAEAYSAAESIIEKVLEVNPHQAEAWAYRAVMAHLSNQPDTESEYRAEALRFWKSNPHVDHLIGKKLSQKYRFAESADYQRRALELDRKYLPAKMQLANDLLRLGNELEGWKLADEVYRRDGYNVVAHNLVSLRDHIAEFATLEHEGFVVRMSEHEAAVYGQQVLDLLIDAEKKLAEKYEFSVKKPVVVEIFPRQQDFAIRTFGLPGGAGFLGVCFGHVITMNSPASQTASPQNWRSVLWHEFCHVVTLQKTNNKMPRWLSEGISVYEERLANPAWGQSMNVRFREMILGDDLTPVSQLSGAFLSPPSAEHLQFAYFESSLVVEYLVETYGIDMINRVLTDLGVGMTINESLGRYTDSVKLLDREFADWVRQRARDYASSVDLSVPGEEMVSSAEGLTAWIKEHPDSFFAQLRTVQELMEAKQWEQARELAEKLTQLHPEYSGANQPFRLLATILRETGDVDGELAALEQLLKRDAKDLDSALRACELASAREDWQSVLQYARRALSINPLIPAPHHWASSAAEKLEDHNLVIQSLQALSRMSQLDPAEIHLRLAKRLFQTDRIEEARREVLKSLEHAPRYREAHQWLLRIVEASGEDQSTSQSADTPEQPATGEDQGRLK